MAEIKKVIKNGTEYDVLNSDTVGSALTAGTGIGISSNTISNTGVTSVNGQTGDVTVASGITKIFTLSSTSDLTTAQAAYDWYVQNGGDVIIELKSGPVTASNPYPVLWRLGYLGNTSMNFSVFAVAAGKYNVSDNYTLKFSISSGTVTAISVIRLQQKISSSVPSSGTPNNTITFVI